MDDGHKSALVETLEELNRLNKNHLRDEDGERVDLPFGYTEALIRCDIAGKSASYRFVNLAGEGPGAIAEDDRFSGKKQRNLIKALDLESLARNDTATFRGDREFDHRLAAVDALRYGGEFAPLPPGREHDVSPCYSHYNIVARYQEIIGKAGPQVGPAINLIAFALFTGLESHLAEGGILFEVLRRLLSEEASEMPEVAAPEIAGMQCHEWCASVPDLDDLTRPPLALIYTIAGCPDHGTCGVTDERKAVIEHNTIAAGHLFQTKIMGSKLESETEKRDEYSFGAEKDLVRAVFARAVEQADCDIGLIDQWRAGAATGSSTRDSTRIRDQIARRIFRAYVDARSAESEEKKRAIEEFVFREFYGENPGYFRLTAARDLFREKAYSKILRKRK